MLEKVISYVKVLQLQVTQISRFSLGLG